MKRVMIVDDEILVRMGIQSLLDWEENGYDLVAEAANGRDAVEKIKLYSPHILLTDLMMEPMNGLELIEYCRERHPDMKIVVLSNYNDFEKVKASMKLGASDFIFKLTLNPAELLAILGALSEEIDRRRISGKDAEMLLSRNMAAIRQRLMRVMTEGAWADEGDLLRELRLVEVGCDFTRPYVLLLLGVANYSALHKAGEVMEPGLFAASLENIVGELLGGRYPLQVFRHDDGRCVVAINPEREAGVEFSRWIEDAFREIDEGVKRYFGMRIFGVLSRECVGASAVSGAVADCLRVLRECFLMKENRLLRVAEEARAVKELAMPEGFQTADWRLALETGQFGKARDFLGQLIERFYSRKGTEPYLIRERLFELYRALKADGDARGIALSALTDSHGLPLYQAISQYELLESIGNSFHVVLERYQKQCGLTDGRPLKKEIARVITWVNANPADSLSVSAAARLAHMSESYFSHVFKEQTGSSFIDYVSRTRVARASELLAATDYKVGEIAAMVGIHNPNYFSILFKKLSGRTPLEYRSGRMETAGLE